MKLMKLNLFIIFIAAYLLTDCTGLVSKSFCREHQDKQPSYSLNDRNILIKMAEKKFGKLTEVDEILFAAVVDNNWADYMEGEDRDKTEDANKWGAGRIINANRIEWLCHDRQAKEIVRDKGIQVKGAKIVGTVDLGYAEVPFPLTFWGCVFEEEINMNSTRIKFLILTGSRTGSIRADGIKVEGGVFLRDGFKADGEVIFLGADIGEDFDCTKGEFINEGGRAIIAERMDVKGTVFLKNGFKANGEVSFLGATIGGDFDCTNGEFINEDGRAILADRMEVKGAVFLKNSFKADGEVRFVGAAIGGDFVCENGKFINEGGRAISADGIDVKGAVHLRDGFKANGEVRFPGAAIGVDFYCTNGGFINKGGKAIFADGMDIKGCVYLRDGFKANGAVRFLGAAIGGDFDCTNGEFINESGKAISADGMAVKGAVFLRDGFRANGEVSFPGAVIGRDFDCTDGEFINECGQAISADGMAVKGAVFLRNGFKAEGLVSLEGATIGEHFFWSNVNLPQKTILDLRNAKTGVLSDDEKSWPAKGNLFLDGFVYENIGDDAPKDANSRIKWLDRQGDERFRPGPYEQLAMVLEKMGHNEDAKKIRIEKEEELTKRGGFGLPTSIWRYILWATIGYGYRSWWALLWIVGFIGFGLLVFGIGYKKGIIVPMEKEAYVSGQVGHLREGYPKFSALAYSIEMFVPVLDLRIAKYWIPDANKLWGVFIRLYMWLHIILGWILTTLLIVGLTGLIKK